MLAIMMMLIGIGLMGLLIYGGTTVLQSSSPIRSQTKENTLSAFYGLASAYQAYVSANGAAPTSSGACNSGTNCCSNTELVPTYMKEVKYPLTGLSCGFGYNSNYGNYFCYYGSVSEAAYDGFSDASSSFTSSSASSSYVIGTSNCGERTSDSAPTTWPANLYITYWLLGQ